MGVGIIGAGTVGSTVAIKLQQRGYEICGVASRTQAKADLLAARVGSVSMPSEQVVYKSRIVLITTPDRLIAPLVQELQEFFQPGQTVIHFSGSLSSGVMAPARLQGAKVLSLHPLQSFASIEVALNTIEGAHFAIEGDDPELGKRLVLDLGGIPHLINSAGKPLYHAGACVASNYLVVLADVATRLLVEAGFAPSEALQALLPLMYGTLANLAQVGLPNALTGPIARGDSAVVASHLKQLTGRSEEVYRDLGLWAIELATAKGSIGQSDEGQLYQLLGGNKPLINAGAGVDVQ